MKQIVRANKRFNLYKKLVYSERYSVYTLMKFGFLLGINLLLLNQVEQILAQDERIKDESINIANYNTDFMQDLKISFDSIKINNDHDLLFDGEWKIDAYVNGKRISLLPNSSIGLESGKTVLFSKGEKFLNIQIMKNDTLRLVTLGIEYDSRTDQLKNYLPDISSILDNEVPLSEDKDRSRFSVEPLTAFDRNDAIGIIV